jgi:hypothetical protein
MVRAVMFAERHLRIRPIDGRGRRIDEVLGSDLPATFEDMQKAGQVRRDIVVWMGNRMPDAGLCGEVNNALRFLAGKQFLDGGPIRKIAPDEMETVAAFDLPEAILLQLRIVIIVMIVQPDDFVAKIKQLPCCKEANKSGGAGHQNFHAAPDSGWIFHRKSAARALDH